MERGEEAQTGGEAQVELEERSRGNQEEDEEEVEGFEQGEPAEEEEADRELEVRLGKKAQAGGEAQVELEERSLGNQEEDKEEGEVAGKPGREQGALVPEAAEEQLGRAAAGTFCDTGLGISSCFGSISGTEIQVKRCSV